MRKGRHLAESLPFALGDFVSLSQRGYWNAIPKLIPWVRGTNLSTLAQSSGSAVQICQLLTWFVVQIDLAESLPFALGDFVSLCQHPLHLEKAFSVQGLGFRVQGSGFRV